MAEARQAPERAKKDKEKLSNYPVNEGPCGIGKTKWKIWNSDFEVDDRFRPMKAVGKGAYGTVCSAMEVATGKKVAIKKIANCFEHDVDARRTLRECMLLRHLRHPNVVGIKELFVPVSREFKDLYIVQDLMDTDLHQIIRSSQPLSNEHLQFFVYQILKGLKYIHSAGVLHRDLKPSNLLLTATCDLKICDFGLARTGTEEMQMTEYVVTRWYRAPELLLSCDYYSESIDVWAVGCILAELLKRRPYFPGKDYMNQLIIIIQALGMPTQKELEFVTNPKARKFINELDHYPKQPFCKEFPTANPDALDLLERMLKFDPRQRISVEDALDHPYLATFRGDEPIAPSRFHFTMEDDQQLKRGYLRRLVVDEIAYYHPNIEQIWQAQDEENKRLKLEQERLAVEPLKAAALKLKAEQELAEKLLGNQNVDASNNLPSLVA